MSLRALYLENRKIFSRRFEDQEVAIRWLIDSEEAQSRSFRALAVKNEADEILWSREGLPVSYIQKVMKSYSQEREQA